MSHKAVPLLEQIMNFAMQTVQGLVASQNFTTGDNVVLFISQLKIKLNLQ